MLYDGGDKLFVPVENIEVLSRFGAEEAGVQLDRLGGAGWQARKARVKKRIREIAGELIRVAAERQLKPGEVIAAEGSAYAEFCARFPYPETEDQPGRSTKMVHDLAAGRPMDRLICGDVGFGKTEVALRAAFLGVMSGLQVAIVVPTTLLARQHYRTFSERFAGLPVKIGRLSRLTGAKETALAKAGLAAGTLDIVIGTHALLGKQIAFKHLGLLIVDEEQHFGVAQKERLKQLRSRRARADADGDADPAHPAAGTFRRARHEPDRDAAGRPAGRAHLRAALRSGGRARGDPARAFPRRAELLRLSAHRGHAEGARAAQASWCPR